MICIYVLCDLFVLVFGVDVFVVVIVVEVEWCGVVIELVCNGLCGLLWFELFVEVGMVVGCVGYVNLLVVDVLVLFDVNWFDGGMYLSSVGFVDVLFYFVCQQ